MADKILSILVQCWADQHGQEGVTYEIEREDEGNTN